MNFDWMQTPGKTRASSETKAMRDSELLRRAQLFANLGYSRAEVEKRLRSRLEWEHEGLAKAAAAKRVGAIVGDVFSKVPPAAANAGAAKKPKPKR